MTLRLFVNPLVAWIWVGGAVVVLGAGFAMWPARRSPATSPAVAAAATAPPATPPPATPPPATPPPAVPVSD